MAMDQSSKNYGTTHRMWLCLLSQHNKLGMIKKLTTADIYIIDSKPTILPWNHPTIIKPNCPRTTNCLIGTGIRHKVLLKRINHPVEYMYIVFAWAFILLACCHHTSPWSTCHQGCCSKMIWLKFAVFPSLVLKFIAEIPHRSALLKEYV